MRNLLSQEGLCFHCFLDEELFYSEDSSSNIY